MLRLHGGDDRVISGVDIRRYRKSIDWTQAAFSKRMGVTQSHLSQIEGGRTLVSDDHIAILTKAFSGPEFKPTFREFLRETEKQVANANPALTAPGSGHVILHVYRWEDGFDLSRAPAAGDAIDLVIVRANDRPLIAFGMPKATPQWSKGEIVVFEQVGEDGVSDGDLCLVQLATTRPKLPRTLIASVQIVPGQRGKVLQIQPVSPAAPVFAPGPNGIQTLLRASFRGQRP
jgi:transcriptional regulator with XRE-family HTH domain